MKQINMDRPNQIISIKGYEDIVFDSLNHNYEGYVIETTQETILILIDNQASCCEIFGHVCSDDDFSKYKKAVISDIIRVDEALDTLPIEKDYKGEAIFINVVTNIGTIQFALYNSHNGYYGHHVNVFRCPKYLFLGDFL